MVKECWYLIFQHLFLVDLLKFPGDVCFSSGVLGPDGTNRYLGKWCKRGQMKGSNIGDLITVGADGRGGRVKVLRSSNQSSMVGSKIHFPVQFLCAMSRISYQFDSSYSYQCAVLRFCMVLRIYTSR